MQVVKIKKFQGCFSDLDFAKIFYIDGAWQFCDKVRLAVGILRFVNIGSDTGSGSADLIGNDRFVLTFQEFHQIEHLHGKVNGKCTQSAFSNKDILLLEVNMAWSMQNTRRQRRRVSEAQ